MKRTALLAASLLVAFTCFLPFASCAAEDEVDTNAVLRLGNSVELVGDGISDAGDDLFQDAMAPPADDNHKWFLTIYETDNCGPCAKLKRDLATDRHLRALVNTGDHKHSWAHLNVYHAKDEAQAFRYQQIRVRKFPTIVIQPPGNGAFGPKGTVVAQIEGYSSGADLTRKIAAAIKGYCKSLAESKKPRFGLIAPQGSAVPQGTRAIGGLVGFTQFAGDAGDERTPPWRPRPKEDPAPAPDVAPLLPGPLFPELPPLDLEPAVPPIPKAAQIVVVTDGSEEAGELGPLQEMARRLKERHKARQREMDFEEAKKLYPVTEDELPLVLVTADGKIEAKILGRILDAITPPVPTPAVKTVEKEKIVEVEVPAIVDSVADIPLGLILQIFTGGLTVPSGIALAVWALKTFRKYRKATNKPLLVKDDGTLELLLEQGAPIISGIVERILAARAAQAVKPTSEPIKTP